MKRLLLIPLTALLGIGSMYAQSAVNMAGGQKTINNEIHEWSVGEMTVVSAVTTSTAVVTHGILQPIKNNTNSINKASVPIAVSVYPNPATEKIYIDFKQTKISGVQLLVYDAVGRLIIQKSSVTIVNKEPYILPIDQLSQGVYTLKIIANDNKNKVEGEFKIQKIN